jgi:tRNA(Ile)-lysidine synthase
MVREFVRRECIGGRGMVVAVSGGPDSVALLLALTHLRAECPEATFDGRVSPLIVAHVNHKLRGEESDNDERFVRDLHTTLADRAGMSEFRCTSIDVASAARQEKGNLEAMARRLRYQWLADVALDAGFPFVATGHTADDQAETVLFRLLRGTGLKGLSGIAPRRLLKQDVEVIRPLLEVSRAEILEFLTAEHQSYCRDSTNFDRRYTRNKIRHELIPQLTQQYNLAIVHVLSKLARQSAEVFQIRENLAREQLARLERPRAGSIVILDSRQLAALPRHFVREVFHVLWTRESWPMRRMGFGEWDRLADLANGDVGAIDLPDGVHARRLEHVVQIERAS